MTPNGAPEHPQAASDLVADLLSGLSRLVRGEIALARAEATRSLKDAAGALIAAVIAAILGITALNVLAGAAVAGLVSLGLSTVWASFAVGAVLLAVTIGLLLFARQRLSPENLAPTRSMTNLRRDAETLKAMVTPGATADVHS
jgi:Putative Actinobacterial Holin-X, holin superfamily III